VPGILWAGKERGEGHHQDGSYTSLSLALSENLGVVTNYDVLSKRVNELLEVSWGALVLDEAHAIKGGYLPKRRKRDGTIHLTRYHHVLSLAQKIKGLGGPVWELTATPILDRRRDLWAQLNIVLPGVFGSSYSFTRRYCDAKPNQWGGWDTSGKSNTEELAERLSRHFVLTTRAQVASELPALQRDLRLVSTNVDTDLTSLGGGIERAIDRAAHLKKSAVYDLALEYLASGLKILVATSRKRLVHTMYRDVDQSKFKQRLPRQIRESLKIYCVTGDIEPRKRGLILKEFNQGSGPAITIATLQSLQETINLHFVDAVLVAALPYTPGSIDQFEGRFARLGGTPCTIHYLIAQGTIDEKIRSLLLDKLKDVVEAGTDTSGKNGALEELEGKAHEQEILSQLNRWLKDIEGE
jgi:hypothetical protein